MSFAMLLGLPIPGGRTGSPRSGEDAGGGGAVAEHSLANDNGRHDGGPLYWRVQLGGLHVRCE